MKAYEIKKKTAERLLAVIKKKENTVMKNSYYTLTNEESAEHRNIKCQEIYNFESCVGLFKSVLQEGNYGDLERKELIIVNEMYKELTRSQVFAPDVDLDWFNKKMPKIIKNWK